MSELAGVSTSSTTLSDRPQVTVEGRCMRLSAVSISNAGIAVRPMRCSSVTLRETPIGTPRTCLFVGLLNHAACVVVAYAGTCSASGGAGLTRGESCWIGGTEVGMMPSLTSNSEPNMMLEPSDLRALDLQRVENCPGVLVVVLLPLALYSTRGFRLTEFFAVSFTAALNSEKATSCSLEQFF
jgi:hypothetical protein